MNGLRDKFRQESKTLKLFKKSRGYYPLPVIFMGIDAVEYQDGTIYQPLKTGWRKLGKKKV